MGQKPPISLEPTANELSKINTALSSMSERQGDGAYQKYSSSIKKVLNVVMGIPTENLDLKAPTKTSPAVKVSQISGTTFNKSSSRKPDEQKPGPEAEEDSSQKLGM